MIALERLETLLTAFPSLTIGLVGDLFLDRYLDIDPDMNEPSPSSNPASQYNSRSVMHY